MPSKKKSVSVSVSVSASQQEDDISKLMPKKRGRRPKDKSYTVNGQKVESLSYYLNKINWDKLSEGVPVNFHGDLQFDNIIYNEKNKIFKLIDWRSDFNNQTLYGDLYYDLSKLYGGCILPYNQIKNNNFTFVSDKNEIVNWNCSNNGQSSSIFNLGLHKIFHPDIHYVTSEQREAIPLSNFIGNYDISYNFINLDIQGAELKALKGMESYLNDVDYIYTEVNCDYVYEGCALINEIDEYLLQFNLHRVETTWFGECKWGDAFYIRKISC